jgi:putative transposase
MIDRNDKLSISRQAKLLGISRGSVYYLPQGVSEAEMALMRQIDELHLEHPFMGVGQLERHLRRLGFEVGRQHVRTLMLRMDIQAMVPQPGSSKPAPGHKIYPYLLRNVAVERADHVWALDTTYIPMRQGFVYLTAILDVATRRVMAHKVATTLEACHAREIMQEALSRYGTPEIISTDQGSQFTAQEFTDVVLTSGARLSMDGRGAWRDNVFVERMWRSVKYEHVYKHAYASVSDARAKIASYLDWYNSDRPHSSINDQTPDEAYLALLPELKKAA